MFCFKYIYVNPRKRKLIQFVIFYLIFLTYGLFENQRIFLSQNKLYTSTLHSSHTLIQKNHTNQ